MLSTCSTLPGTTGSGPIWPFWELKGRVPNIFDHPQYGAAARELYDNARRLLDEIVGQGTLRAAAVYGFWPAESDGDDLVLFEDKSKGRPAARFGMLRQQSVIADGKPNRSLADFVAPAGSGLRDHVGAFAVTAGLGLDEIVARFEAAHDDYHALIAKALADRLAEALAEWLHERARREWGYGADERLNIEDLVGVERDRRGPDECGRGQQPCWKRRSRP